jgi:hypothetical protein
MKRVPVLDGAAAGLGCAEVAAVQATRPRPIKPASSADDRFRIFLPSHGSFSFVSCEYHVGDPLRWEIESPPETGHATAAPQPAGFRTATIDKFVTGNTDFRTAHAVRALEMLRELLLTRRRGDLTSAGGLT